jgi:hexosaminidase
MRNRYENLLVKGNKKEAEKYLLHDLNDKSHYKSVQGWKDNVVCVAQESVYTFLEHIVNEFVKMYDEAGVEFTTVHTGGDEVPKGVWTESPICNNFLKNNSNYTKTSDLSKYFITRYNQILQKYNLKTAGWEEIALEKTETGFKPISEFATKGFIPYVWNNVWNWGMEDVAYQLANKDFPVVLCNVTNLYFDLAYEKNPEEPGYYWGAFIDTRAAYEFTPFDVRNCSYTDLFGNKIDSYKMFEGKEILQKDKYKNIIGIQGQLWSENTKSPQMLEYMLFPKLLALAERAWRQPTEWSKIANPQHRLALLNKDWNVFANTLGKKELKRLDVLFGSINYRLAPPAAKLENGILSVLSEFPGIEVRYTVDGSEPNSKSTLYINPITVNSKTIKLKSFSTNGRESRCEEKKDKR